MAVVCIMHYNIYAYILVNLSVGQVSPSGLVVLGNSSYNVVVSYNIVKYNSYNIVT